MVKKRKKKSLDAEQQNRHVHIPHIRYLEMSILGRVKPFVKMTQTLLRGATVYIIIYSALNYSIGPPPVLEQVHPLEPVCSQTGLQKLYSWSDILSSEFCM